MLDEITAALGRHSGVSDWTVRRRRSRSLQLYLIGSAIESVREVNTDDYEVEVLNDHPFPARGNGRSAGAAGTGDGTALARGSATIKLVGADRARLEARLDDAVLMAQLVHNPAYALVEPGTYPDVPLADPQLATSAGGARAADAFADELRGLVDQERRHGVRLSAAELFLTHNEVEIVNSRGVRTGSESTVAMAELALLARPNGGAEAEEAEHFRQIEARRLADLRLPEQVAEAATFARDTLRARPPQTRTGAVVLSGDALISLFEPFAFHASASAHFTKLATLQPGQDVCGEREVRGDRLTLRSNALRPYGRGSYRFDGDGVPGQDVLLVEHGVLRALHASQRYARYLQIPVTGQFGTTQVALGTTPLADLLGGDGPVYHVAALSAPEVDSVTGDFGSEIRLGYEVSGGTVRPIKGGSVGGNVFEAFADARFSREPLERGDYAGPRAVRFASLRVAGDD
jgi:PmbA protein